MHNINRESSRTLDFISIDKNIFSYRQIEFKNGLVFMRMKIRKVRKMPTGI